GPWGRGAACSACPSPARRARVSRAAPPGPPPRCAFTPTRPGWWPAAPPATRCCCASSAAPTAPGWTCAASPASSCPSPAADHRRAGPPSVLVLQRVADGLHPDEAVAEHEGVDAVFDLGPGRVGGPLQEEDVALVGLSRQLPLRVQHVGEQLREPRPHAVLTALDPGGCDEDRVIGVVGDDLVQVTCDERLGV